MEKRFTAAIPREWIGKKVKVLTSIAFSNEIKGIISEVGADYIVVGQDIINAGHIVKIRKA
jgi:hypothetical protein